MSCLLWSFSASFLTTRTSLVFSFNMSRTNVLSGAHNFVVSGTLNAASPVHIMLSTQRGMLIQSIACRSSRTTLATDQHPTGLSLSCSIQAINSQAGKILLPNSKSISLLLPKSKGGSTFFYMEWGVLERPRFA